MGMLAVVEKVVVVVVAGAVVGMAWLLRCGCGEGGCGEGGCGEGGCGEGGCGCSKIKIAKE